MTPPHKDSSDNLSYRYAEIRVDTFPGARLSILALR